MKITNLRTMAVKIPQEESFGGPGLATRDGSPASGYALQKGWRGLYSRQTETTLVKIETDEGVTGYGEGQAPVAPEVTAGAVDHVLRPILMGRNPMMPGVLRHEMYNAMNVRGHYTGFMLHAISAVDLALWDIQGKVLGCRVADLLGGAFREFIPVYVSGVRGSSAGERAAYLAALAAKGFHTFKTFLGFGLEEDLEQVRAFGAALGSGGRLLVDVLWNYDVPAAIRLGRLLEREGCGWLEAPTSPEDVAGHAEIARALDLPVAAGETEVTRYQFLRWFEARALDVAQPDVARCGITEIRKIADLAETFNIPIALHCGVLLGPGTAASLQVAASIPNLLYQEFQPVMLDVANRFLKKPLVCEQGFYHLPQGPGLGIEIDEAALASYICSQNAG